MSDPSAHLAAEIIADCGRRGSGFMVARGIVLTALHVLLDDRPPGDVRSGLGGKIRFNGDLLAQSRTNPSMWREADNANRLRNLKIPWHRARLIWPTSPELALRHDIALLELEDPGATSLQPLADLRAHLPTGRPLGCRGEGYPVFRMDRPAGLEIWECEYLEGELLPERRRQDDTFAVRVETSTPQDKDGWKGMSGAAIWFDSEPRRELVGVAHTRAEALSGNKEIRCWPLSDITDPDFWRLSGLSPPCVGRATTAATAGEPLGARLKNSFFRFDRARATDHLRLWLRGDPPGSPPRFGRHGPPARPAIVLLRGHRFDEPMLCAERFAEMFATEAYSGRASAYRSPIVLPCGLADDPAELRLDGLLRRWAEKYVGPVLDLEPEFKAILLSGLAARDRSRLIVVEHKDATFGEECAKVIGGLAALLGEWEPGEQDSCPPVVLVNGIIGTATGPPEAGYLPLTPFEAKEQAMANLLARLSEQTPLRDGRPTVEWFLDLPVLSRPAAALGDVSDWLDDLARRDSISLPSALRSTIEAELRRLDEFPVRFAKDAVHIAVEKQGI